MNNCTACPTIDRTRGDIQMAVCEERAANKSFACVCGNFPAETPYPLLRYYPHVEEHAKVCANFWETASHVHTAVTVPCVSVLLYAAAHFFYIVVRSEMCWYKRCKCTKIDASAFFGGTLSLCQLAVLLIFGVGNISGNSGADDYTRLNSSLLLFICCSILLMILCLALFYTSIVDTVYSGEEMACMRRSISLSFWIPFIGSMLCYAVMFGLIYADPTWMDPKFSIVPSAVLSLTAVYAGVFMILAHRKMLKVSLHAA